MHALHCGRSLHLNGIKLKVLKLIISQNKRTDGSVRTDICALVTLYAVLLVPNGNECLNTTLLISGGANHPRTIGSTVLGECAYRQQVTGLSVDRTNQLLNECGSIILLSLIIGQVSPLGLNCELLVLTTTIYSGVVQINNILTLCSVRLQGGSLHLLNCKLYRDNLCDAEESRLKDGVGTVTQTNLLSNLGSVDGINSDIVLSEVTLYLVRHELLQLLTLKDGVEQELTVLLQTAGNIVHVQVSLNVACNEVRCGYQIG